MGDGAGLGGACAEVVVDTAISPFCLMGEDGSIRAVSASITELLGWKTDEIVGRNMAELLAPESLERALEMMARYRATGEVTGAWRGSGILADLVHADGTLVPCDVSVATPARTGLGGFVLQLRRRGSGAHLQRALAAMAENQPLARILSPVAAALSVEIADARTELHWGWDGERFAGSTSSDGLSLLAGDDGDHGERPWLTAMTTGVATGLDDLGQLPAGVRRWALELGLGSMWAHPVVPGGGDHGGAIVLVCRGGAADLSSFPAHEIEQVGALVGLALEWERGRTSLRIAAHHDPLTGLANRRTLLERLRSPVAAAEGTVLFCDVDDFKPVNDEHGHGSGDAVLQVIGERLRQAVRPSDLVARYGGDEFVVHCPGTTDRTVVAELVERLERVTAEPITVGKLTVHVGLSVGKATIAAGIDVDDVLADAARDMSDVKRRRKHTAHR